MSFWRKVLVIMKGTVISQAVFILSVPIITSLYNPSDYGSYVSLISYALILHPMFTLGLDKAILIKTNLERREFFGTVLTLSFILFFFFLFLITLLYFYFDINYNLFFESISVLSISLCLSLISMISFLIISESKFELESNLRVTSSVLISSFQVLLYYISPSQIGLILSDIISKVLVFSKFSFKLGLSINSFRTFKFRIVRENLKFCTYGLLSTIINLMSVNAPYILVGHIYGASESAIFFMAMKLGSLPIALIGSGIGKVYSSEIADKKNGRQFYVDTIKKLAAISLFIPLAFYIGKWIAPAFFGDEWNEIGEYLLILSPLVMGQLISGPIMMTFSIYRKQEIELALNVIRIILVMASFCLLEVVFNQFRFVLMSYSFLMLLVYLVFIFFSYKIVPTDDV